jgi:hypothetical protein
VKSPHPAFVSIRQHSSAYVSIRHTHTHTHTRARAHTHTQMTTADIRYAIRRRASAYVSIRQHTSAYASIPQISDMPIRRRACLCCRMFVFPHLIVYSAYVSIRQHTSAYVIRRRAYQCCRMLIFPHLNNQSFNE